MRETGALVRAARFRVNTVNTVEQRIVYRKRRDRYLWSGALCYKHEQTAKVDDEFALDALRRQRPRRAPGQRGR